MPSNPTLAFAGPARQPGFFGWRVVWAAFTVGIFGWGVGFYGPPIFLQALHEARGWPISLLSAAITCHFLLGALVVANLAALYRRFGMPEVTTAAALAAALGALGWALAAEPWQLFAATLLSGFGWAATGAAAINAMVAPWFIQRRPAALSAAYNGATIGGVLLSPLWVALIAGLGFAGAAAVVGGAMVVTLAWLSARVFSRTPAGLGQFPDGAPAAPLPAAPGGALPGSRLWRDRRFTTLTAATSLSLFAQIGIVTHLFSLLVPVFGSRHAGFVAALVPICAILGRVALGWLLPQGADRRRAVAANYALQICGTLLLLAAGGTSLPLLLLGVVLFGVGLGNSVSLPPLIAQQDFSPAETARVVALVTACSQASYAFAPAAFGALREWAPMQAAPGGAPLLFLTATALYLLAALTMLARGRAIGVARAAA
jgi:MFS family permease